MKLLRVIATLDSRHGGPAAGLRAITPELARLGHETTFVSVDAPGEPVAQDIAAPFIPLGPSHGGYGYSPKLMPWLREHAREYDAVFVHGLWQYHGRAVRAALRGMEVPYFVFPHGMLDPWFRRTYPLKHLKKWIYWQLIERNVLRDASAVFFTCDEERRLARESFHPYSCNEKVVAYGTAGPRADAELQRATWHAAVPELGRRPFWLFLGRIHPKKGVDLLLRSYGDHARAHPEQLPTLVLAGPCADDSYRATLENLVKSLPKECAVIWAGMLEGAKKWGALRCAEAFILPSHQENFGIAVVEALAVGTPVLISRKVNIWEEIESEGAGFADSDDVDGTRRLLDRWRLCPGVERQTMRQAASKLFTQRYEIGRVARSLVQAVSPFLRSRVRDESHDVLPPKQAAERLS